MRNSNASQWNIGCFGSSGVGAHVGHVHFMLFVSILCALGSQGKHNIQWNMGFNSQRFWISYNRWIGPLLRDIAYLGHSQSQSLVIEFGL